MLHPQCVGFGVDGVSSKMYSILSKTGGVSYRQRSPVHPAVLQSVSEGFHNVRLNLGIRCPTILSRGRCVPYLAPQHEPRTGSLQERSPPM